MTRAEFLELIWWRVRPPRDVVRHARAQVDDRTWQQASEKLRQRGGWQVIQALEESI